MSFTLLAGVLLTLVEPLDAERAERSSISIAFNAYSSDASTIGFGDSGGVRVDAVWIALQDVRVRPAASCKRSSAKAVIAGAFTVELVTKQLTASQSAELELGRYCVFNIQLRRSRGKVAGAPVDLRGASIVIEGRRADGVRFVLQSRLETAPLLQARELEGFAVSQPRTSWIVGVDVARWLTDVDLGSADVVTEGRERRIRIDEKTNADLLDRFNANVESGFALFEDTNEDRNLDPEERATPIAVPR